MLGCLAERPLFPVILEAGFLAENERMEILYTVGEYRESSSAFLELFV